MENKVTPAAGRCGFPFPDGDVCGDRREGVRHRRNDKCRSEPHPPTLARHAFVASEDAGKRQEHYCYSNCGKTCGCTHYDGDDCGVFAPTAPREPEAEEPEEEIVLHQHCSAQKAFLWWCGHPYCGKNSKQYPAESPSALTGEHRVATLKRREVPSE